MAGDWSLATQGWELADWSLIFEDAEPTAPGLLDLSTPCVLLHLDSSSDIVELDASCPLTTLVSAPEVTLEASCRDC